MMLFCCAGTGKSVTGAHLAYAFALWNRQDPAKRAGPGDPDKRVTCVVYCGPSNKSVDVVLSKFPKFHIPEFSSEK